MFGIAPSCPGCSEMPQPQCQVRALITATDIGRSASTIVCRVPRSSTKPPISALLITMPISNRPDETHTGPAIISNRPGHRDAMDGGGREARETAQIRCSLCLVYCNYSVHGLGSLLHTFTPYCYGGEALRLQARIARWESPTIPTCKSLGSEAWPQAFVRQRIAHVGFCGPPRKPS
ncbi:hypothetical protein LZ32DRAFT_323450 [Colletotrichum eremochloae]|nr:hypothetical protein LZ32DRAFT_323450 [Colletotrichum eremochloae]